MFLRLVADSFTRRPRRKLLTAAALALGMAVATAALSVSLDVGDRLAQEFRSLGANLLVTPQADSLPLEIGGVDYRPVNAGAYLPEADLGKLKTIFWHNNILGFAPVMEIRVITEPDSMQMLLRPNFKADTRLIGTWASHGIQLPEGSSFSTGIEKTNLWWRVDGSWFHDDANECIVGKKLAEMKGFKIGDNLPVYQLQSLSPTEINLRPLNELARTSAIENVLPKLPAKGAVTEAVSGPVKLRITGVLSTGGQEDDAIVAPLAVVQKLVDKPGQYRKLYVSALTKPEDDFGRRDPKTMTSAEFERWSCSPYVSSIAYSIKQALPGADVRVIRRVAEGEGNVLRRVRTLLWLVTIAALLAAALAVGASSAASVIERRSEIGLMKALGAASALVRILLAAEQLLLAFVGGGLGYALGIVLARLLGEKVFGVAPQPSLLVFFAILALAAIITLLGSALPLRRASRYEPAPILRGE